MVRHILAFCCVGAWLLVCACTNEYEDFTYVSEGDPTTNTATTGPGPNECNGDFDCDDDEQCIGGDCSCEGGPACFGGDSCCAGEGCVDLDDDSDHCGSCGNECPMGQDCNNGFCGF